MARHRLSSKRPPPEIGLHMECVDEELEPSQIMYYTKADKEYTEIQNKLDNYVKKLKAEVVEKSENCLVLQLNTVPPSSSLGSQTQISTATPGGKNTRQSVQSNQNYQQMVGQGILTRSSANTSANTYLVMDSGLSFMMGQMQSSSTTPEQSATQAISKSVSSTRSRQSVASGSVVVTTRGKMGSKKQTPNSVDSDVLMPPTTRTRDKAKNQSLIQLQTPSQNSPQVIQEQQIYSAGNTLTTSGNYRIKVNAKQIPPPSKPTENNAVGGLSAGSKTTWKPNSDEVTISKGNADSREITFNKVTGKTFPSLVVVARPHLKAKFISQSKITQERSALDAKVKGVLMYTTTKFTEWLIQQGLIRSEQVCQTHLNNDLSPVKLKLGMYSDISKFPYSGGYVWISDCCPSQFVSVFSGSIFEGAPHPPTTLLKLIYHWACQTNVQNIVQWVKVDNLYVKNFFTNMRAVCTQAVHEKYKKMGGQRKKIEVGVISLGTTSQDGNKRQVKVEVLGVMDYENKLIRLRAVEPHSDERSFKRRFVRILQPLEEWVSKDSTILTDFTVNKAALNSMGFHTVFQVTSDVKYSNQNVMEYLRRIVPRMFQNTLSLLSRQIIQQFLDELVWREVWGPIPSQAFVSIIAHMAEQTKLDVTENFLVRLSKVAANPFKEWNYSTWISTSGNKNNSKTPQKSPVTPLTSLETISTVPVELSANPGKSTRARKRASEQSSTPEIMISPVPPKKMAKVSHKEKFKKEDKNKGAEKSSKKDKETGEKLSEEVIKFIDEEKQIPLESYYYGSKKGLDGSSDSPSAAFNAKCCVCYKRFAENIAFMKHMILHFQTDPELKINIKKVYQCENCFLGFNTSSDLEAHLEEVHFLVRNKIDSEFVCHICEKKFTCRNDVVFHMQRTHVEMELPYECGVCRFRTSVYRFFVKHFVEAHRGEGHVFCPYCLKAVEVSHGGSPVGSNVHFYMSHLEKHQRPSLIRDCNCCQLSFIHKGILDQHLEADHGSWKGESGVESLQELDTGLLMPEPGGTIKPLPVVKLGKSPKAKNLFAFNKFKALDIRGLDENSTCIECEEFLLDSEHFAGNYNCSKCRYATCCEKAMNEHIAVFHEITSPQFNLGKPTILETEMYCVCGFSTFSGNRIAKHLALCEKNLSCASVEFASALVCDLESPKENSEESPKSEGQNMLNMLGLVRKSPEIGVAEEEMMEGVEEEGIKKDPEESVVKENVVEEPMEEDVEKETVKEDVVEELMNESVETETAKEDVEGESMKESVESETAKEDVEGESVKESVESETAKEDGEEGSMKDSVEKEIVKEDVKEGSIKDSVEKETAKEGVEEELTKESVEKETAKEDVEGESMKESVESETTKEDMKKGLMKESVESETAKEDVEEGLTKESVEKETAKEGVEGESMQESMEIETAKEDVEEGLIKESVESETAKEGVEEGSMKGNAEEKMSTFTGRKSNEELNDVRVENDGKGKDVEFAKESDSVSAESQREEKKIEIEKESSEIPPSTISDEKYEIESPKMSQTEEKEVEMKKDERKMSFDESEGKNSNETVKNDSEASESNQKMEVDDETEKSREMKPEASRNDGNEITKMADDGSVKEAKDEDSSAVDSTIAKESEEEKVERIVSDLKKDGEK